jgi:hypothetical protein
MEDLNRSTLMFETEILALRLENDSFRNKLESVTRQLEEERLSSSMRISQLESALEHTLEQIQELEVQKTNEIERNRILAEEYTSKIRNLENDILKMRKDAITRKFNADKKSQPSDNDGIFTFKKQNPSNQELPKEPRLMENFNKLENFLQTKANQTPLEPEKNQRNNCDPNMLLLASNHFAGQLGRKSSTRKSVRDDLSVEQTQQLNKNDSVSRDNPADDDEIQMRPKSKTATAHSSNLHKKFEIQEKQKRGDFKAHNKITIKASETEFTNDNLEHETQPSLNSKGHLKKDIDEKFSHVTKNQSHHVNFAETEDKSQNRQENRQTDKQNNDSSDVSSDESKDFFDETAEIDFYKKIRQKASVRPSQIQINNAKKSVVELTGVSTAELLDMIQTLQHLYGCEEAEKKQVIEELLNIQKQRDHLKEKVVKYKTQIIEDEAQKIDFITRIDELKEKEGMQIIALNRLQKENEELNQRMLRISSTHNNEESESISLKRKIGDLQQQLDESKMALFKQSSLNASLYHDQDAKARRDRAKYEEAENEVEKLNRRIEALLSRNKELLNTSEIQAQEFILLEQKFRDLLQEKENSYEYRLAEMKKTLEAGRQKFVENNSYDSSDGLKPGQRRSRVSNEYGNLNIPDNISSNDYLQNLEKLSHLQSLQALNIPESMHQLDDLYQDDFQMPNIEVSEKSRKSELNPTEMPNGNFNKTSKHGDWGFEVDNKASGTHNRHMTLNPIYSGHNHNLEQISNSKRKSAYPAINLGRLTEDTDLKNKTSNNITRRSSQANNNNLALPTLEESVMLGSEKVSVNRNEKRISALIALQNAKYSIQNSDEDSNDDNESTDPVIKLLGELNSKNEELFTLRNKLNVSQSLVESMKGQINSLTLKLRHTEEDVKNNEAGFKKEKEFLKKNFEEMTEMFIKQKLMYTELASNQDTMIMGYNRKIKNLQYEINIYKEQVQLHNSNLSRKESTQKHS